MTTKTTISVGEVRAKRVLFSRVSSQPGFYIVSAEPLDCIERFKFYPNDDTKSATGLNLDGTQERFYLVAVSDCFDPPVAIVRADGPCEALEIFADELTWAHVTEPDLADYDEESLHYNDNGQPYETDNIVIYEVRMLRVEC